MVDMTVYAGNIDPYETLVTAESEAYADNIHRSSNSFDSGYLWDLYKLLQVPSRLRVFVARIATPGKCKILEDRIEWVIKCYGRNLREGDRIFSLVLPTARRDCGPIRVYGWMRIKGPRLQQLT